MNPLINSRATTFLCLVLSMTVLASRVMGQDHPLVGTWEMVSVKGIDADGVPFFLDTTSVKETKIITPTHYMLIAWDVEGNTLSFNRTMAGQVVLDGSRYIEIPTQASVQIFDNVKVDFSWKLDGDLFTQSGSIIRPDGKKVVLEALIFKRKHGVKANVENPAIGAWNQLSASCTTNDGRATSMFNESDKRILIVTPTHWMRMDHKNNRFDGVHYGTYRLQGSALETKTIFSNYPALNGERFKYNQKIEENKLVITSVGTSPDGKPATMRDVLERAK